MRPHRSLAPVVAVALALLGAGAPLAAQDPSNTAVVATVARLAQARALLNAGDYAAARAAYTALLGPAGAVGGLPAGLAAAAHFGRGVATQELLRAADSAAAADYDDALADYATARRLDSAAYFGAGAYNAALLERALGRYDAAAALFADAAAAEAGATRARALLRAAESVEASGSANAGERALPYYRQALAVDPTLPAARLALARWPAVVGADSVVATLTALLRDSSAAPQIADAALSALVTTRGLPTRTADTLLTLAAAAHVIAGTSPEEFALSYESTFLALGGLYPSLGSGAELLRAVYLDRPATRAEAQRSWWGASWERLRVLSATQRAIGEWHDRAGRDSLAAEFYRAALGLPGSEVEPWTDLQAVLPLVASYDRRADSSAGDARARVLRERDALLDAVFNGKSIAYQSQEVPRIRQFHMALGAYFASRKQWEGAPRGAIFQLEHMRETTARLPAATRPVDPPQLLEQLLEGYVATERWARARALVPELRAANRATGRADTSAAWSARVERAASASAAAAARRAPRGA